VSSAAESSNECLMPRLKVGLTGQNLVSAKLMILGTFDNAY
jgi:hypothetical protein